MHEQDRVTRREWLAAAARLMAGGGVLAAAASLGATLDATPAHAATAPRRIVVYKDAACGCCTEWVTHLRANGFAPEPHDRTDLDTLKDSLGVPVALRSCHTAVVGRYLVEGHVPAADIVRLLATTPAGVLGLAAPGMPKGSPGMEMPGVRAERYEVLAFGAGGRVTVFASHG
jgi:hypothetical protein